MISPSRMVWGCSEPWGKCGVLAHLTACIAGDAAARVGGVDELGEPGDWSCRVAWIRRQALYTDQRDVVGELHECEFGGGFDGAAAVGDGCCAGGGEGGAGVGDAVGEDELRALLDSDAAGGDAGFLEGLGKEFVGVFVFVPGVDAGGFGGGECGWFGFHALANAALFEDGQTMKGAPLAGRVQAKKRSD